MTAALKAGIVTARGAVPEAVALVLIVIWVAELIAVIVLAAKFALVIGMPMNSPAVDAGAAKVTLLEPLVVVAAHVGWLTAAPGTRLKVARLLPRLILEAVRDTVPVPDWSSDRTPGPTPRLTVPMVSLVSRLRAPMSWKVPPLRVTGAVSPQRPLPPAPVKNPVWPVVDWPPVAIVLLSSLTVLLIRMIKVLGLVDVLAL